MGIGERFLDEQAAPAPGYRAAIRCPSEECPGIVVAPRAGVEFAYCPQCGGAWDAGRFGSSGHPEYLQLLDDMKALHVKKAADYGRDDDPLANLRASAQVGIEPWRATWLRAKDKVTRIDTFCVKGTLANEGVEDSLKDLAAYCLLALVLFREAQA
ncbi:MAG TPA: hypothetical protein VFG68_22955 [Fimbriiglobus sp.]|nr:hypothetical protein [Fimbriiglobus sp.]